jgi:hypothetical protein
MPEPTLTVLGVYALHFDDGMLKEQTDRLYGPKLKAVARQEAERRCREQLASTVLIGLDVRDRDDRFDVAQFTQPQATTRQDSRQSAWAEVYLSPDGETRLETLWPDPPRESEFRVAFFLHFWNPSLPLMTSYGELQCPQVEPMPERLLRLVPYQLLD